MKEIKAVIQPHKLARVRGALFHVPGFNGMTVFRVEGMSRPGGPGDGKPSLKQELTDYSGKVFLAMVAEDEAVDAIVQAIAEASTTGQKGDGLVWVLDVERVQRIRDTRPSP
ncbi:MAG: P-II family nitrogen regulator [Betaproteobacteria bacterium]|nr:P-II family nitrogen regulator [Betaproteobacteria bacterium]